MSVVARTAREHGAVLLEVVLALTIFIGSALAILGAMGNAADAMEASRLQQRAVDLARSAMAKIEAGIESAETLNGPVPLWRDEEAGTGEFEDDVPAPSGWELEVRTEPFATGELTLVEIIATKKTASGEKTLVEASLRQLVRLSPPVSDTVGEEDAISSAAARGAAERGRPVRDGQRRRGGRR